MVTMIGCYLGNSQQVIIIITIMEQNKKQTKKNKIEDRGTE
jgi:hypothetical protein